MRKVLAVSLVIIIPVAVVTGAYLIFTGPVSNLSPVSILYQDFEDFDYGVTWDGLYQSFSIIIAPTMFQVQIYLELTENM